MDVHKKIVRCLLFTVILFYVLPLFAQPSQSYLKQTVRIETLTGEYYKGTVTAESDTAVTIKTFQGLIISVPRNQIKRITVIKPSETSAYEYTDPNTTRLFFSPTGRSLKHLQGYLSDYELFFPSFAIGLFDFISINAGMSIFPGAEHQLYYIAPKIRAVHVENVDIAAGVLYMNVTGESTSGAGIVFGVATFGSLDYALTTGLGWGFAGEDFADKPVLMVGGEARLSKNLKLLTENWFPPSSDTKILSFGLRFFGRQLAADLGFIYPTGSEMSGFPFIPWVGFAYNFGGNP